MSLRIGSLLIGLVAFTVIFAVVERRWPSIASQAKWRPDTRTDLIYWFFTPLVTKAVTRAAIYFGFVVLALIAGKSAVQNFLMPRESVSHQPVWLQVIEVLLLGDLIGYWSHRMFHSRPLWRFHAVHHSSRQLDWLSSVRLHPINDTVSRIVQTVPFLLIGFSPKLMVAYVPFLAFYAVLLHANVSWTLGPLKYVFASPTFHRWHHTSESEGLDKNFAGLFAFYDILFGTYHMPQGKRPERFGVESEHVPLGFWGQLLYPFRPAASQRRAQTTTPARR